MLLFQLFSHVWLFATSQAAATRVPCPSLCPGVCLNLCLLNLWCHPTISFSANPYSSFPQSFPPSIRAFFNELALCISWPKYWSFVFSINPSNEYSGLISFRIDWFNFLAVQGTLKSLLQHHSSKASILQRSVFFMVQHLQPYMTTGKSMALTVWTFVSKVMFLLFNTLSRFVARFVGLLFFQGASIFSFQQENVGTHQKEIPHVQGQRRSHSKMVGGVHSLLKSNLISSRDTWRAQTKPCAHQNPGKEVTSTVGWTRLACDCLRVSCGGMNQEWPATGMGGLWQPKSREAWHVA